MQQIHEIHGNRTCMCVGASGLHPEPLCGSAAAKLLVLVMQEGPWQPLPALGTRRMYGAESYVYARDTCAGELMYSGWVVLPYTFPYLPYSFILHYPLECFASAESASNINRR